MLYHKTIKHIVAALLFAFTALAILGVAFDHLPLIAAAPMLLVVAICFASALLIETIYAGLRFTLAIKYNIASTSMVINCCLASVFRDNNSVSCFPSGWSLPLAFGASVGACAGVYDISMGFFPMIAIALLGIAHIARHILHRLNKAASDTFFKVSRAHLQEIQSATNED